jgi:hypothetical protein
MKKETKASERRSREKSKFNCGSKKEIWSQKQQKIIAFIAV